MRDEGERGRKSTTKWNVGSSLQIGWLECT